MLKKITSLIVSEAVINKLLNSEQFDHSKVDGLIECYQNGREHGHVIWLTTKNVAYYICQARRSDDICIYKGSYAMQSISEDAYRHSNSFKYNDLDGAVDWLLTELGMK
jgi:hypothetical protein